MAKKKKGGGFRTGKAKGNDRLSRKAKKADLLALRQGKGAQAKDAGAPDLSSHKEALERTKVGKRLKRQQLQKNLRAEKVGQHRATMIAPSLSAMNARAQSRTDAFVQKEETKQAAEEASASSAGSVMPGDNSRKAYMRELRKTVASADVILEVLDARDPQGCRCQIIEDSIKANPEKKLILVLNKTDLVPVEVVQAWVKHLRQEHPCLPFKASTQEKTIGAFAKTNLMKSDSAQYGGRAVGTDALMQLLKNYCRNLDLKTAITVGVIGYPNVGKSSLINSLKRSRAVSVSATAGHTKMMQEVILDKKIRLIDSPGVVFDDSDMGSLVLRNCLNVDGMADPVPAAKQLIERCDRRQLMQLYDLGPFENYLQFLGAFARKRGKLGRGGIADMNAAAKAVVRDWSTGKIPAWAAPPEAQKAQEVAGSAVLLGSVAEEFDVESAMGIDTVDSARVEGEEEGMDVEGGASSSGSSSSAAQPAPLMASRVEVSEEQAVKIDARIAQGMAKAQPVAMPPTGLVAAMAAAEAKALQQMGRSPAGVVGRTAASNVDMEDDDIDPDL